MTVMLEMPATLPGTRERLDRAAERLAPCRRNPERWTGPGNDVALVQMCRTECPRRFACAVDAVNTKARVEGIWAGVFVPANSSRTREYALRRLDSLASLGRRLGRIER